MPASYVFMFHHVSLNPTVCKSSCMIDTEEFKQFVLRYSNCYASLGDVVKGSRKKIAITFDDGLADIYSIAYPFLKEHKIPFTVFIVTDFIGKEGYITEEQLLVMAKDPLVTIGSHGVSHEIFTKMDSHQKKEELTQSKEYLEHLIETPISVFAYSHGQFDKETLKLVKCYDYAMSVKACPLNYFTNKKYLLPRYNIEQKTYPSLQKIFDRELNK